MKFLASTVITCHFLLTFTSCIFPSVSAASTLSVTITEGPTECDDKDKATKGRFLSMAYTGTIDESSETGEKKMQFESNVGHEAFEFQIGANVVIKGWEQGLLNKCKGAKVTLIIPPDLAYGDAGAHNVIPGGATLRFDVEILDVHDESRLRKRGNEVKNVFTVIDTDKDGILNEEEILAYFISIGLEAIPPNLFEREDTDRDGKISWEEFSGPKGDSPPAYDDEL